MAAYIQSLLFEPNNMSSKDVIDDIREIMLSADFKNKYRKEEKSHEEANIVEEAAVEEKTEDLNEEYIKPYQKDTLFWCLYIAKNGYGEYKEIKHNYGSKQLGIQKTMSEQLKKNMVLLKNVNIRITKVAGQEILSDLLTDTRTTGMYVLYGYAICYEMNLILLHPSGEYYLEIFSDQDVEEVPMYILQKDERENYSIREKEVSLGEYKEIQEKKYRLESHLRPLKAVSNYKTEELNEVGRAVGIDINSKKRTKSELYEEITKKIQWY